ncbi:MAG: TIR domain-containing protein [Solobacterium sp.]|nr:TIR domain-containing protein [Solobacterium sp.]
MSEIEEKIAHRHYKAFISYRHKPLDMEFAKKLHKRIEHFTVPEELRKNGEKKPGLVFRDQDELPISDNLTKNIQTALDNSEFLIVICSPDTPGSIWVQREITYFLSHHSRDKLLAMLVAGEPDESFPPQLTEIRDDNGDVMERIEPLAANINARSAVQRNRLFQTESLRILAALIGCPYDRLYQREQRYKIRRILYASLLAGAVALGFIGMLVNRNNKIQEQLKITKVNESKTLAELSRTAFRDGDYRGALNNALDALPGRDPGRPYVAAAENALAGELYLYRQGTASMRYLQSFEQETDITKLKLSADGSRLALSDTYGNVAVYETEYGQQLWKVKPGSPLMGYLLYFTEDNGLLVRAGSKSCCYDPEGKERWSSDKMTIRAVSEKAGIFLYTEEENFKVFIKAGKITTGETVYASEGTEVRMSVEAAALSDDGRYAALLDYDYQTKTADLYVFDLETGVVTIAAEDLFCRTIAAMYELRFTNDQKLAAVCSGSDSVMAESEYGAPFVILFDGQNGWQQSFARTLDFGSTQRRNNGLIDTSDYPDYVGFSKTGIYIAAKTRLLMVDRTSGEIQWQKDLPGYVISGTAYENGSVGLVLNNGVLSLCTESGALGYDVMTASYECDYDLHNAAGVGINYAHSKFAVISDDYHNRVTLIGYESDPNLEKVPFADQIPADTRLYYSPSGTIVGGVRSNTDEKVYELMLWDTAEENPYFMKTDKLTYSLAGQEHIFVTDDGKIIAGGMVFDLKAQTVTGMTISKDAPKKLSDASCRTPEKTVVTYTADQSESDKTYSYMIYENGVQTGSGILPVQSETRYSFFSCGFKAAGAAGYAILSVQQEYEGPYLYKAYSRQDDAWFETPYLDPEASEAVAVGEKHSWAAVMRTDDTLTIYDIPTGEAVKTMNCKFPGLDVTRLIFTSEDRWLAAFTKSGDLAIYSTEDGTELHKSAYSQINLHFYADSRYDILQLPEEKRMLIIIDDNLYREPGAVMIDTGSMEKAGFYYGVSGYLPEKNKIITTTYNSPVCFAPLYTTEDIQKMAEQKLGNEVSDRNEN